MNRRACLVPPAMFALASVWAATANAEEPKLKTLRYDEDWTSYCRDSRTSPTLERLKCLPIAADITLTLGAELRERAEAVENPAFGIKADQDQVILHRALLHADLRAGSSARAFVQIGNLAQAGREGGALATDADRLDLMQGFLDISSEFAGGRATVRGGRQEIALGSSRLVAVRDAPNARRSFDGVRAFLSVAKNRIDAFYLRPVDTKKGLFDNSTSRTERLYGVYLTRSLARDTSAEIYWLGYRRELGRFANAIGQEQRDSFGARFAGRSDGWDWNFEGVYQSGSLSGRPIRAWTLASDTGFTMPGPLKPRLGLRADAASGNHNPVAGNFGTFNALYPRFSYFSEANLFVPANIIDLHPQVGFKPTRNVDLTFGVDFAWRESLSDAVYTFPLTPIARTAGQGGRFSGKQLIADASWQVDRHLQINASLAHFAPGAAVRSAGGASGVFAMLSLDWRL